MPPSYRTQAIVLRRILFRDHDRILTLFSRERGKISVIAKGIRKPNSKRQGHLELFNQINGVDYQGHGLDVLGETSLMSYFSLPEATTTINLTKIMAAYHLAELVDAMLPDGEPHDGVFSWLLESFRHLHQPHADSNELTRAFKYRLLQTLGFWPHQSHPPADIDSYLESVLEKPLKTRAWMQLTAS